MLLIVSSTRSRSAVGMRTSGASRHHFERGGGPEEGVGAREETAEEKGVVEDELGCEEGAEEGAEGGEL